MIYCLWIFCYYTKSLSSSDWRLCKLEFSYSSTDIREVGNNRVSSNVVWLLSSAQLRNRFRKNSWYTNQQTRTVVHAWC